MATGEVAALSRQFSTGWLFIDGPRLASSMRVVPAALLASEEVLATDPESETVTASNRGASV